MASNESSTIQRPKNTTGLKNNCEDEKMVDKFGSKGNFQLDFDIKKIREKPIFQEYEKSIYEVECTNQDMLPTVVVKLDGTKAKQEASFYTQLSSHPHIVRTYGLVQSSPESIMLVQERPPQGNLSELFRKNEFQPSERVLWNIFEQICDAMIFLAQKSIIHGNLACRNVLVFQMNPHNPEENLVKLTDFGFTRVSNLYSFIDTQATTTMKIIPIRSAAPELLKNPKKPEYSEKSDVYSMGVLMWEACSYGEQPYSNIDDQETVRQLKLKNKMLSKPSLCSDLLWTIINECWNQKPKKRPNFQSLKQSISNLQSKSIPKLESAMILDANSDPSVKSSQLNEANNRRYEDFYDCKEQDDDTELIKQNDKLYHNYAENVNPHEATNIQNGSTSCPFCKEYLPSSMDAHDHFVQCGSKTEQCPNCQLFIQRSVFAYHYENNCADINDIEISDGFNNPPSHNFSRFSSENSKEKTQSTISNIPQSRIGIHHPSNELVIIPCEYCQEQYSGEQLRLHEASCLKNPNGRPSSTRSSQERPATLGFVRSTASPKRGDDKIPVLTDEDSNSSVQNSKIPSRNQNTDGTLHEHYCCCCS